MLANVLTNDTKMYGCHHNFYFFVKFLLVLPDMHIRYIHSIFFKNLRWLDTYFKNSGVEHFDMFKLNIVRIYSADILGIFKFYKF